MIKGESNKVVWMHKAYWTKLEVSAQNTSWKFMYTTFSQTKKDKITFQNLVRSCKTKLNSENTKMVYISSFTHKK